MKNKRDAQRTRRFAASRAHVLILIALTFVCASALRAAEYPNKAIQIINPFPPGAITDIVARIVSPKISTLLGQPVLIINKAGGGGAIGHSSREGYYPGRLHYPCHASTHSPYSSC